MPLYKRNGNWHFHFEIAGKRYRKSTKTSNKKEAERIEARAYAAAEKGESLTPKKPPVLRDLLKEFETFFWASRIAKQTKRDYRNGCRLILSTKLAGMRIDQITADHVEVTHFHDSPYSTNCALRTLRRALHKAVEWKKLTDCPKFGTVEAPPRNMIFTAELEDRVFKHPRCTPVLRDFLCMMIDGGFRDLEALSMKVQYVQIDHGYYANLEGKTVRARRRVPLSNRMIEILQRRCAGRYSGFVFRSEKSKSGHVICQNLQKRFREIRRELGYPEELKIYCGRHTYGNDVMDATGNPWLVKESMGHADFDSTEPYLRNKVAIAKSAIDQRNLANQQLLSKAVQ